MTQKSENKKSENKKSPKRIYLLWAMLIGFVLGGIFIVYPTLRPDPEAVQAETARVEAPEDLPAAEATYSEEFTEPEETALPIQEDTYVYAVDAAEIIDEADESETIPFEEISKEITEEATAEYEQVPEIHGRTPLMRAARYSPNPEVLQILIDSGAYINAADDAGWTALIWAARNNGSPGVIQVLIDNGADIEVTDEAGWGALIWAVRSNPNPEILQTLIERGANVNAPSRDGVTPLMHAAMSRPASLQILLGNGADASIKDNFGSNALDFAERNEALRGTDVLNQLREKTLPR